MFRYLLYSCLRSFLLTSFNACELIGLVVHEPRKFTSRMFGHEIFVATTCLTVRPLQTDTGPGRNAIPNQNRKVRFYAP